MRLHPALVPVVHDDESPASACSRVAVMAGRTARDFCLDMGFKFQHVVEGRPHALAALAVSCGYDDGILPGTHLVGSGRSFRIGDATFTRETLSRQMLRVCAHCLAADMAFGTGLPEVLPYHRTSWTVGSLRTCSIHLCPLVPTSNVTKAHVLHDFARLLRPNLGRILKEGPAEGSRAVSRLERHLIDRIASRPVDGWLGRFPAYGACRISEIVGAVRLFGRRFLASALSDADWHRAGGAGFEIADAGPVSIQRFLAELSSSFVDGKADWGPKTLFGRLYEWLAHESDDPAYDPLRELIRDHVLATLPIGSNEEIFGIRVERRRIHSIQSLALETRRSPKTVRKLLLRAGLIDGMSSALTDERVRFDADAANELLASQAETLTRLQMRARIGAPRPHDSLLIEARFIRPRSRAADGLRLRPVYGVEDIDAFLRKLTQDAKPPESGDPEVADIPSVARRCTRPAMDIVRLLLEGRLKTVRLRPDTVGYMSVLVNVAEVLSLTRLDEHDGLTLREAKAVLRTNDRVLKALVVQGHLSSRRAVNPVNRYPQTVVDRSDLEAFMAKYVSATEIARATRRRLSDVICSLRDGGVHPVFDRAFINASFYERASIPEE